MKPLYCVLLGLVLSGCASAPPGANVATADFNKYDKLYEPFPIAQLRTGMSKSEVAAVFGNNMTQTASSPGSEIFSVERWESVTGPDYVKERLFLRIDGGRLAAWKIENSTVTVAPRSW